MNEFRVNSDDEFRVIVDSPPKPAPDPTDLGEWRGFRLSCRHDRWCQVGITPPHTETQWWWPGLPLAGTGPRIINALLTARRRAVERGLATWPEGWEWAKQEMLDGVTLWDERVFLGYTSANADFYYHWPCICDRFAVESRRRAAMLGLCEAKPAPDTGATWEELRRIVLAQVRDLGVMQQQLAAANATIKHLTWERDMASSAHLHEKQSKAIMIDQACTKDKQLAARDAEIVRLKAAIEEAAAVLARNRQA